MSKSGIVRLSNKDDFNDPRTGTSFTLRIKAFLLYSNELVVLPYAKCERGHFVIALQTAGYLPPFYQ